MVYCTYDDVRELTNLTTSDITNDHITALIGYATSQLNHAINSKIIEEKVTSIDITRENKIDGSNKTFYVQNSFKWYIGDRNDDGSISTADITVYKYAVDGTRTEMTVGTISAGEGKFILSVAPESGSTLKVTYSYAPVDEATPDSLIKHACVALAASLCYTKTDAGKLKQFKLGKLTVARQPEAFNTYFTMYQRYLNLLKTRMLRRTSDEPMTMQKLEEKRFP